MKKILMILFALIPCVTWCQKKDTIVYVDLEIIKHIESNGNRWAWNKGLDSVGLWDDSYGLYQITRPCLNAYNQSTGQKIQLKQLWDERVNKRIAHWMFTQEIPLQINRWRLSHTLENYLICYNAGIAFLVDKKRKGKISHITWNYIAKYKKLSALKANNNVAKILHQ